MRVNEAVVISLPERHERLQGLLRGMPTPWPFPALRVASGVRSDPPPWFKSSPGAYGRQQAHLNVLRSAWERGVESTLVLEDDAVFSTDFAVRWWRIAAHIPHDWSMVMLGGQHLQPPDPSGLGVVRCRQTRRTHAYIIRLRAIPLLMRTWQVTPGPIDRALAGFQHCARVYAPRAFLVGQSTGDSDVSRTHHEEHFWI